jgi:hypothetical protein
LLRFEAKLLNRSEAKNLKRKKAKKAKKAKKSEKIYLNFAFVKRSEKFEAKISENKRRKRSEIL